MGWRKPAGKRSRFIRAAIQRIAGFLAAMELLFLLPAGQSLQAVYGIRDQKEGRKQVAAPRSVCSGPAAALELSCPACRRFARSYRREDGHLLFCPAWMTVQRQYSEKTLPLFRSSLPLHILSLPQYFCLSASDPPPPAHNKKAALKNKGHSSGFCTNFPVSLHKTKGDSAPFHPHSPDTGAGLFQPFLRQGMAHPFGNRYPAKSIITFR